MSGAQQFRDFAADLGYELPQNIEPGRRFRFSANGKRADDAGWGIWFSDGEGGVIGDWRTGDKHVWQAKRDRKPSPEEYRAWQERIEREKREAEAERERAYAEAAARARQIDDKAERASNDHPYLRGKGVRAHGVEHNGRYIGIKLYRGDLVIADMRCDGALIVPMRDAQGNLHSLQFIAQDGEKRYLTGGRVQGCYSGIGKPPRAGEPLLIGEGYATVASAHYATGYGGVVAFDAGNLPHVAAAMRAKYPQAQIVICADNDIAEGKPNVGVEKAREAAKAIGARVAVPELDGTKCDFNDLAQTKGLEAVKRAIEAKPDAAPASAPAAQSDDDGWPAPKPLPDRLPPVLPFSMDLLPDELRGWISDIAQRVQCPPEFPAVAAIAALGSVIGRKLAVRPKAKDDWEEFPNLWGVIVGSPGVLKTPALMEALRPLRALESAALEQHKAEIIEWQARREAAKVRRDAAKAKARQDASKGKDFDVSGLVLPDDDQEPQPRRYIVNDSSIEALGMVLRASPNGVLAYRDELIGLLKSLDREGMEGARAFYLSAYSGKEAHVYDRIGRGLNIRVDHVCISMLGSIQPSVVGRYLREAFDNGGDDGLLSRFSLLVWPDVSGEWRNVDRWPDTDARRAANALFERMEGLDPLLIGAEQEEGRVPFLRLSDSARACFVEWREAFEKRQRDSEEHPALVAHFAKYRKLVPALALIFHLGSRGTGPISEAALLRALAWAELLESHARRAYASVQQARTEAARALLAKIRAGAVSNPIEPRDVYLKGWSGLSDPRDARRAMEDLEDLDYLRSETLQTGGRSKTVYWINPRARTSQPAA
jgi:putative DNA primase/helicase